MLALKYCSLKDKVVYKQCDKKQAKDSIYVSTDRKLEVKAGNYAF